jgi:Ras-related protein Rab-11A
MRNVAGAERFHSITTSYYRGAAGAMLVYDICDSWSFNNVPKWLKDWRQHSEENSVLMLVGNKSDRNHSRQVSTEEAEAFAVANGLLFAEVSANDTSNLESAFLTLLSEIFRVKVGPSD